MEPVFPPAPHGLSLPLVGVSVLALGLGSPSVGNGQNHNVEEMRLL